MSIPKSTADFLPIEYSTWRKPRSMHRIDSWGGETPWIVTSIWKGIGWGPIDSGLMPSVAFRMLGSQLIRSLLTSDGGWAGIKGNGYVIFSQIGTFCARLRRPCTQNVPTHPERWEAMGSSILMLPRQQLCFCEARKGIPVLLDIERVCFLLIKGKENLTLYMQG